MRGPFYKKREIEVKNRENALSIVYPTTEPGIRKKSDQKQHVIPPISNIFFSAKKTSRSRSLSVIMFCFFDQKKFCAVFGQIFFIIRSFPLLVQNEIFESGIWISC